MTAIILKIRRQPYLGFALFGCVFLLAALIAGVQEFAVPESWRFLWQVATGAFLTLAIVYQWILLVQRLTRAAPAIQRSYYMNHRWVGSASFFLFALHAISFGHMLTNALAVLFIGCAITGVMNKEIMKYRREWTYQLWFGVHVAFSALLAPLIIAHIWVALAFEGI
ncbi:MAG: hypothetical protein AAF429_02650 [Pseudomonadota bacterium]